MEALRALEQLEPATLAQYAGAVAARLEDFNDDVCGSAFDTLSGLPRYVTRSIAFTSKELRSRVVGRGGIKDLCSRLLGRAAWYRCRLRLCCWRGLALFWYALPYRPSGPGHARDVEAWGQMNKRSRCVY